MADSRKTRYTKKDDEKSSAVYDVEEMARDIRSVKDFVRRIVVDEEADAQAAEAAEAGAGAAEAGAAGAGAGAGAAGVEAQGTAAGGSGSSWRFVEGLTYWLNVDSGERSQTRPELAKIAQIGIGAIETSNRDVVSAYEDAARLAAMENRNQSATIQLRRACNFVKDGPIRVCLSFWIHALRKMHRSRDPCDRMNVLDLCCGRGQDFDKYRRACRDSDGHLGQLLGVDIAGDEVMRSAHERWKSVGSAAGKALCGGVIRADISRGHAAQVLVDATSTWPKEHRPHVESYHLASCMFALHYFWSSEVSFTNLVMGAAWLVREGGFFVTVHADGEAIAALYRSRRQKVIDVGMATITLHDSTMRMLDSATEEYVGRPFGWAYDFNLPGAVANVSEYLVHSPTRDRIMESHHFVKLLDEPADSVLMRMRTVDYWDDAFHKCRVDCDESGTVTEDTLDHLALYRVCIYVKNVARVDVEIARRFIRSKLGF
jgi:SAM-dependent methyltransferase